MNQLPLFVLDCHPDSIYSTHDGDFGAVIQRTAIEQSGRREAVTLLRDGIQRARSERNKKRLREVLVELLAEIEAVYAELEMVTVTVTEAATA